MNFKNIIKFILPFSNEIADALTLSGKGSFKRVYIKCPHSWNEIGMKTLIDMMALGGIIWNVSFVSSKYTINKGILYGINLIIMTFLIPNITMEQYINYICESNIDNDENNLNANNLNANNLNTKKCNPNTRLLVALLYIGLLFITEYIISAIIINYGK
jgi:hypothetical protein